MLKPFMLLLHNYFFSVHFAFPTGLYFLTLFILIQVIQFYKNIFLISNQCSNVCKHKIKNIHVVQWALSRNRKEPHHFGGNVTRMRLQRLGLRTWCSQHSVDLKNNINCNSFLLFHSHFNNRNRRKDGPPPRFGLLFNSVEAGSKAKFLPWAWAVKNNADPQHWSIPQQEKHSLVWFYKS
jgi:hypothetical protein